MLGSVSEFLRTGTNIIWFMITLPVIFGIAVWISKKHYILRLILVLLSSAINFLMAISLYQSEEFYLVFPFASLKFDIAIHIYKFPAMFLLFTAAGFLLISLYSVVYLKSEIFAGRFMFYMYLSLAMINGAVMSDNLGVMLFFWEGLLCTLFGLLLINNEQKPKTAVKALVLSGTADLLLMLGIIITAYQAGTPYISQMQKLPVTGISGIGFVCMMLGALGKAGCMPFHSWIPNAADDAPTPFMAAFPGALEKLLGIYLAVRIITDIYDFLPESGMSFAVMTLGTLTIIFAAAMALIQKDMKRLLSYHAVSQVGYMVLGLGTALPIGIIAALFHMLNNAIYKSCLFMTSGSIEKQTGTTDLRKIGGLAKNMPVTMTCFVISGCAIAGVPFFNGFFSKELIFDAALESNIVFYIGALLGAFLTAVSFLKVGRAAFSGKLKLPPEKKAVTETRIGMIIPMVVPAALCLLFGIINTLPLDNILGPALGYKEVYSGWHSPAVLVIVSVIVLVLALCNHIYGCKKSGSAINSADHIHYAPGLKSIYNAAEKHWFDPYNQLIFVVNGFSAFCAQIERGVSWIYDVAILSIVTGTGNFLHRINDGSLSHYLVVAIAGIAFIVIVFLTVIL